MTTCGHIPECADPQPSTYRQCDDCHFGQFGDMLSPGTLRTLILNPEYSKSRDRFLWQYEQWGLSEDADPLRTRSYAHRLVILNPHLVTRETE